MRRLAIRLLAGLLLAAPAAAAPTTERADPRDEEALVQMQAAVAAMREELYRPGPVVPGWNVGGADPDAALRAAGADRHFFLFTFSEGPPSVAMLSDRGIADFAPPEWRLVDSYGSAGEPVDRPFLQFFTLSPRYVMGARANSYRRDNVDCVDRISHARLYERPGDRMTEEDESAPLLFRLSLLAIEGMTTCTRYEASRDGGWVGRPLLPDGRSLPALDGQIERVTVVPAAPIDELLRHDPSSRT